MTKILVVEPAYNNMRLDRWLRNKIGKIPQSLIEKSLRSGKIKINKKKKRSSYNIKKGDKIEIFNFTFEEKIYQKKIRFNASDEIIKENENLIIDNNDDFQLIEKII